ncbi:MAG: hypothetical protein NZ740_09225 [Kiritimatiellae bacterium]|nr:hypothetical protein [Kiritimatiellia bacterium]MDW8459274.1 hypothetical protein [Verrucomicrobiota bacterium]
MKFLLLSAVVFAVGTAFAISGYVVVTDLDGQPVPPTDPFYPPTGLTNVVSVAVPWTAMFAIKANGQLVVWGTASNWNWGILTPPSSVLGTAVILKVHGIAAHAVALRNDGKVFAWGYNGMGRTNVPPALDNVVDVSAGGEHTLAVRNDGTVYAWGNNVYGQTSVPSGLVNVIKVAAGGWHSVALKNDGTPAVWGLTGGGPITNIPPEASNITEIACTSGYTLALRSDGRIIAWGLSLPTNINSLSNIVSIAAGYTVAAAVRNDGRVIVLGWPNYTNIMILPNLTNVVRVALNRDQFYDSMPPRLIAIVAPSSHFDQDGDGLHNWWESNLCGTATCANPGDDPDGDGLSNLSEFELGTSPTLADSDEDSYSDGYEVQTGTNPLVFESTIRAFVDTGGGTELLAWSSKSGEVYSVWYKTNLLSGPWTLLTNGIAATPPTNVLGYAFKHGLGHHRTIYIRIQKNP